MALVPRSSPRPPWCEVGPRFFPRWAEAPCPLGFLREQSPRCGEHMSDQTFTALVEIAFFVSMLVVGVWLQMGNKPLWARVIGVLLTIFAFGLGIVSVVTLAGQFHW